MKKTKKERAEEIRSGKTADLRNVIQEIQKVDRETADLTGVVREAQRIDRKRTISKDGYTCRLLFSSLVDKILLILLLLAFIYFTYIIFKGSLLAASYGFWFRFLKEIGLLFCLLIAYIICNWLYICIIKSSLTVTKDGVYKEFYFPFYKKEDFIPLEHITSVSLINFIWIFRGVFIHRYNHIPVFFPTWNNQKFKDRLIEVMGNNSSINNSNNNKSLLQEGHLPVLQWITILFIFIIFVLGMIHFFGYMFSNERKLSGTYSKGTQKITLKANGTCELRISKIKNIRKCTWTINREDKTIDINYEYMKNNYYGEAYKTTGSSTVKYDNKSIQYDGIDFNKK